ncbi:hypothetical protein L0B53_02545 [Vibrio sp. SS-MA-C1-2]|uniref:hypothetical protein n=1 Tax=Vibrio sp. SS-MA-C1-2 TaxID=2908646 RepID=UPI001F3E52D7|nr:hypothetical protein [Vibrio sp. SS-MA-C1-2]UJF16845.1 hypothetical protein L0B53_02545 [Vibrio sp. SS-MA-C1-2]
MIKKLLPLTILFSPLATADNLINWWDMSLTGLYGQNYEFSPSDKETTITFETAGDWKYGDWFAFQDVYFYNDSNTGQAQSTYGEIGPRFSVNKIFGTNIHAGPLTDVSLALTLEEGRGPSESFLYGVGLDFDIPYFNYFQLNTYRREALNDSRNESYGWQLTPSFSADIPVGNSRIIVDGYIDWVFATEKDDYKENFHLNPQVKYDLGQAVLPSNKKNALLIGIEYDYWKNIYGNTDGVDQNTFSFIIKSHF